MNIQQPKLTKNNKYSLPNLRINRDLNNIKNDETDFAELDCPMIPKNLKPIEKKHKISTESQDSRLKISMIEPEVKKMK